MPAKTATPAPAVDTARQTVNVEVDGVSVLFTKRADPSAVADGVKFDGRLMARYDSHTRVYGAGAALVPALWEAWTALIATDGAEAKTTKAARARFQFHAPRALRTLLTATQRAGVDLNSGPAAWRPIKEGKITYSVDGGHGLNVAAHILPGTLRLDGVPVDVTVTRVVTPTTEAPQEA